MKKGKIIILNGVSSSGKTTLAKTVQDRSPIPLYKLDIDDFILMAPEKFNNYENGDFSVQYAFASKFFYVVKLYSDLGFDLIVPYMFFKNSDTLQEFRKLLNDYPVLIVNIVCPVEELQRRETQRENRKIGSAEEQLQLLETDFENSTILALSNIGFYLQEHKFESEFYEKMSLITYTDKNRYSSTRYENTQNPVQSFLVEQYGRAKNKLVLFSQSQPENLLRDSQTNYFIIL